MKISPEARCEADISYRSLRPRDHLVNPTIEVSANCPREDCALKDLVFQIERDPSIETMTYAKLATVSVIATRCAKWEEFSQRGFKMPGKEFHPKLPGRTF